MARPAAASMDLLRQIQRDALEPGYASASATARASGPVRGRPAVRQRLLGGIGLALAAALIAMAAVQTNRQAPVAQSERADLIAQIRTAETAQDQLKAQIGGLDAEVAALQAGQLAGPDAAERSQSALAGLAAVKGPGIVVVVDDATALAGGDATHVTDQDLRQLVNGLWTAGAEAVAVNGHRITARTAIRAAGSAITVDYRSLDRPYTVQAIGNPASLGSDFAGTDGGRWWSFLHSNYGLGYQVSTADSLELAADPGLSTSYARAGR